MGGSVPLLARWTSEFDCGYETNWWYCVKNNPFQVADLKAKRRYEINKGRMNFRVLQIDPREYAEAIIDVELAAWTTYPESYRPAIDKEKAIVSLKSKQPPNSETVFGAMDSNGKLQGFCTVIWHEEYCELSQLKVNPEMERHHINAALVAGTLENLPISDNFFVCDGERNILHETHFQDYLEKYFGFRKAYFHLNIEYNPIIRWIVNILYPFRAFLQKFDNINIMHSVNGVMKMESIVREDKRMNSRRY